MRLTSERLEVIAGERIRAVSIVSASLISVLAAGGLDHLIHELEDVAFRDVMMSDTPPIGWRQGLDVPTPGDLEWLVWWEATPTRTASLSRDLTEDVRIVRAWPASEDREPAMKVVLHPYATKRADVARVPEVAAGVARVRAFGVAYPLREGMK